MRYCVAGNYDITQLVHLLAEVVGAANGVSAFFAQLDLVTQLPRVVYTINLGLAIAVMLAVAGQFVPQAQRVGIYQVMSGDLYFRAGRLPWLGLAVSAAVSGALLYTAKVIFEGRDF